MSEKEEPIQGVIRSDEDIQRTYGPVLEDESLIKMTTETIQEYLSETTDAWLYEIVDKIESEHCPLGDKDRLKRLKTLSKHIHTTFGVTDSELEGSITKLERKNKN